MGDEARGAVWLLEKNVERHGVMKCSTKHHRLSVVQGLVFFNVFQQPAYGFRRCSVIRSLRSLRRQPRDAHALYWDCLVYVVLKVALNEAPSRPEAPALSSGHQSCLCHLRRFSSLVQGMFCVCFLKLALDEGARVEAGPN